ncbi:unnamed protein product [Lathyrus sativus]|nr:unnamed protein product [Lathyrus sativus]
MPEIKWSERVEVKGKVKLHEFETYIRDLPNSPNRRLMVVSLYWKEESSKEKLEGIKKVGRKYVMEGRVGLAKVRSGVDLYVCPCSYTILNLLAKHGFYHSNDNKTNNNYLVGCLVWKRNQINLPPTQQWSPIRQPCKSSVQKYPFPMYSDLVKCSEEDTKQSSPIEVSHKRMMEQDMDISPQKKPCYRDDKEKPNFIAPSPAAKILPPILIPKNDFTYLGPSLMREKTHYHAYINLKPDFTYLGPERNAANQP